jgi:hypothetical protein
MVGRTKSMFVWYPYKRHHLPPQMKNQHGLNDEKTFLGEKTSQLSACDVTRVVSLDTNNQAKVF